MHQEIIRQTVAQFTGRTHSLLREDVAEHFEYISNKLEGRSVLVIGGAGSIGSAFVKEILRFPVSEVVIIDHNENGLAELVRDIRSQEWSHQPRIITYPFNFGQTVFRDFLTNHDPFHVIANFAALKHVRSEKDIYAVKAMFRNNVLLNIQLLELLKERPPEHFFCVSTDKATNPANLMGATKKLMEDVMFTYNAYFPIVSARFANVAFSNGSLLDSYIHRYERNQPLVCPNDIRRYFVSQEEAGQLCLLACLTGHGGEIFIPRFDEGQLIPFKNTLLAFLNTLGLKPYECSDESAAREACRRLEDFTSNNQYPVYFFASDTTGEKPFEEFFGPGDDVNWDRFKQLGVIQTGNNVTIDPKKTLKAGLELMNEHIKKEDFIHFMKNWVPTFQHVETGKYLDDKM